MSLWKISQIMEFSHSPQAYNVKPNINSKIKETSLCACQKGSLTVEAAVVMPLMAAFLVTILFFFRIIQVQAAVEEALLYAGRKTAVESCLVEDDVALYASAKGFLMYALAEETAVERYVEQGSLGVVILGSQFDDEEITLRVHYRVNLPITMFDVSGIQLWNRGTFRKWVGNQPQSEEEDVVWVYIAKTGEVYHATDSCRAIKITLRTAYIGEMKDIRGVNGQKYSACSQCAEEIAMVGMVYYTDYGILYHGKLDCSYIKRTVEKVKLSEVVDRRPCSYCY